ncbi:glycosyltransferase family 9 protein [Sphaerisporangium sp. TRM90804]|uniref:glycosyltransferase family 9 protein n=1 Tax=Sphaerisporangium sp. TRM90804 TaxID=3031113 RepID=UPI0024493074|nr:glycosyltransferase family 9 protein [Sphaerisporangium sp. TRM90804]MDH2427512.1 glycosyltransferase family 9 protein [Sphaerisporangium sp. TRM90804]
MLRARGIGDLLTAVPALRALRRGGLSVALAAPECLRDLAALTGAVDHIHPTSGLDAFTWNGRRPDVAVNMHGRGPLSHRLLMDARPLRLWAYANPAFPRLKGPRWQEHDHEVERWCRLVRWYGSRPDPADLLLSAPAHPSPAPGGVVIHPGGDDPARRWPPDRFAQVARAVAAEGLRVVVTGGARERPMALLVAAQAVLPPSAVLAGRTSLGELCALVAGARLVISGDTGMARLATAYGTPSVAVFGPRPPGRWGPPPDRPQHLVLAGGGDPRAVAVADVVSAARKALSAPVR